MMGAPLAVVRARASIANVDCCRNGGITKDRRSGFGCRAVSGKLLSKRRSASLAKKIIRLQRGRRESAEATEGLLRSWGCCVVAARSCDEALVRLAETDAGRRPDVIMCDYQLSRGMTGVDAIERLRSAFPIPALPLIPALLISGDARCEVGWRGCRLLYKPVNPERFHAALVDAS